ncbi:MAG: hypothetical protein WC882_00580 [Candidatus Gracilibacteria bacterium]
MESIFTGMNLIYAGLGVLILGWVIQFFSMSKKNKAMNPWFILIYTVGVLLLVGGNYMTGYYPIAILNLVSALSAVLVLGKLRA